MKHTKKLIALFLTTLMLIGAITPMSVSASTVDNSLYDNANDGDLLYRVDFRGDDMWQPNVISTDGVPTVTASADGSSMSTTNTKGNIGGEVKGLYLNSTTKYTITFDTYKGSYAHGIAYSYEDGKADSVFTSVAGKLSTEIIFNSNAPKTKMMSYTTTTGRIAMNSNNSVVDAYQLNGKDMWSVAVEIDCVNTVMTLYILSNSGWRKVTDYNWQEKEAEKGGAVPAGCLDNEPLKLTFWQGAQASQWANVEVRKGNIISTGNRNMSDVKLQFKTNNDGSKDLRVVSVIGSTDFSRIGYNVKINGTAVEMPEMTKVYTSLLATYGGGTSEVTLETFGYHKNAGYLTSFVIKGIPAGTESFTLELTPWTDTKDGEPVSGETILLTINAVGETATIN